MLDNVHINKIHARQCLYKVYILGKVFPILLYSEESFTSNFKTARKKRFFNGATSIDSYMLLCKQNNTISINQ